MITVGVRKSGLSLGVRRLGLRAQDGGEVRFAEEERKNFSRRGDGSPTVPVETEVQVTRAVDAGFAKTCPAHTFLPVTSARFCMNFPHVSYF